MTLRNRILAVLIPSFLLLIGTTALLAFRQSRLTLRDEMNREGIQVGRARAGQVDVLFVTSARVAEGLAAAVEGAGTLDPVEIGATLRATLDRSPLVFGASVALVPDATPLGRFGLTLCRGPDGSGPAAAVAPDPDSTEPWLSEAVQRQSGLWSVPAAHRGDGDTLVIAYATPVRRDGRVAGVVSVDVALTDLTTALRGLTVGRTGYAFLLAPDGRLVGHPDLGLLSSQTLPSMLERSAEPGLERLAELARAPGDAHGSLVDPFRNVPSWVIGAPLSPEGWKLMLVYPAAEIARGLDRLKVQFILVVAGAVLLSAGLALVFSSSIARPLASLAEQAGSYARGEYDSAVDDTVGSREIRQLSRTFNALGTAIREHLEAVARESAARERYRQELLLAARIQQSLLPGEDPPLPELADRVDVYGLMRPAKEVGGDFYDVFRLEGDRLGFAVGDVSDKGAPAALFTAMARAMVRDFAERGFQPAEVLRRANRTLVRDNPSAMFITLLYGELDPSTGRVLIASAGHPDPLLLRSNGVVEEPVMPRALPLGALAATRYRVAELEIAAHDLLVLYSDGLTEAEDPVGRPFGSVGIRRVLESLDGGGSRVVTAALEAAARQHAASAEPADDLTILALHLLPTVTGAPRVVRERALYLELPSRTESLPLLARIVEEVARQEGLSREETDGLQLAVDEVATNAVIHGAAAGSAEHFRVDLVPVEGGVKVVVTDRGLPFHFAEQIRRNPGPVTVDSPPGGLGLFLAGSSVDELRYEPGQAEGNRVVMVKRRRGTDRDG